MIRFLPVLVLAACASSSAERYADRCESDYDACKRAQDDGQCEPILDRCLEKATFLGEAEAERAEDYEEFFEERDARTP